MTSAAEPAVEGAVLVVGQFHEEAFAAHIADTFEVMGYPVVRLEAGVPTKATAGIVGKRVNQARRAVHRAMEGFPAGRWGFRRRIGAALQSQPIGLTVVTHDFLSPAEVKEIRDTTGSPAVLWFPDSLSNFGRARFLNAPFDIRFFKDPFIVRRLRTTLPDARTLYLPECFNPACHRPVTLSEADLDRFRTDITTAGSPHAYRNEFFAQLREYDVKIWGDPPPLWLEQGATAGMYQGRFLACDDKARAFLAAKIVVNNLLPAEVWGVNARTFEVAGIGAFQMVDRRPGLAQLFEPGREVVAFDSMADLRDKIDSYLEDPDGRAAIAAAGRQRAVRDHTYRHRLELLLQSVYANSDGYDLPEGV